MLNNNRSGENMQIHNYFSVRQKFFQRYLTIVVGRNKHLPKQRNRYMNHKWKLLEKRQCTKQAAGVYDRVKHYFQLEYQVVPSFYQMVLPISLVLCRNDYSWNLQ